MAAMLSAEVNEVEAGARSPRMGKRSRGPKKKLRGLLAPVVTVDMLDQILELENEAYVAMGGESKISLSELVSEALDNFVGAWIAENGEPPKAGGGERREFIRALANRNLGKLREDLLNKKTH